MHLKTRRAVVLLVAGFAAAAGAQETTADKIARGIAAYTALQVVAARPLFLEIISPSYTNPVSLEERVTAYKYLGASYAVLSNADSAVQFFTSALLFDPFTDLDPTQFSESELGPFNLAKGKIFKVGLRPIQQFLLDPRDSTKRYRFQFVTTHQANVTLELVNQANPNDVEILQQGVSDGPSEFPWDGLLRTRGRIADSTTYILRIRALSARLNKSDGTPQEQTETQVFRVEHSYEPLEDTLPPLPASMRLPEQLPALSPLLDMLKGLGVGAAAATAGGLAIGALGETDLQWTTHGAAAGALALGSGVASFIFRTRNREIPANVAENARREAQRARFNAGVVRNNNVKVAATRLILTPLTGVR